MLKTFDKLAAVLVKK